MLVFALLLAAFTSFASADGVERTSVTVTSSWLNSVGDYPKIFEKMNKKITIPETPATGYGTVKGKYGNYKADLNAYMKIDPSGNPQWCGIVGKYIYIACTEYASVKNGKGWLLKYDLKKKKLVKKGPKFNIGHGQHFGYDPKTKKLNYSDSFGGGDSVYEISQQSLKPVGISIKEWNRMIPPNGGSGAGQGGGFTYDKNGNRFCSIGYGNMKGSPQGIGYDRKKNRIVLVSDHSIAAYDIDALLYRGRYAEGSSSNLTGKELLATGFQTGKELECITFDSAGYGYVITNRPAQVLRSSKAMY